jgi:hypothetical protein
MKPRLGISFSGGLTSAVMSKLCVAQFREPHDISITFANTGCEHEATLDFVNKCDKHFNWGVVWIEAVVQPQKGKGIRHKVVDYETAARYGEPFEEYIKKYGLPDRNHPSCTSRLKEDAMYAYRRDELGWDKNTYYTAVGIRADELDRISTKRKKKRLIYPLADAGWTKQDVIREVSTWPFQLELPGEHYGNCVACWKKSFRKLMTLARDDESLFDFPVRMEREHARTNNTDGHERVMFRTRKSALDIIEMARTMDFEPYQDGVTGPGVIGGKYDLFLDTGSSCGESCEIGADD